MNVRINNNNIHMHGSEGSNRGSTLMGLHYELQTSAAKHTALYVRYLKGPWTTPSPPASTVSDDTVSATIHGGI